MGSSEHPLQQHRSGWPLCAIWDPYVAGDQKVNSQIPGHTLGYLFWGVRGMGSHISRTPAQGGQGWMQHCTRTRDGGFG